MDLNDSSPDSSPVRNNTRRKRLQQSQNEVVQRRRLQGLDMIDASGQLYRTNPENSDEESTIYSNNDLDNENGNEMPVEEEEGENLIETALMDYQVIEELDRYDDTMVDDRDYGQMTTEQKRKAEAELDRIYARRNDAVYGVEMEEDEDERNRRRAAFRSSAASTEINVIDGSEDTSSFEEDDDMVNLEAFDVPVVEFLAQERTRKEVQKRFRHFLLTFSKSSEPRESSAANNLYVERIRVMASINGASFELSYEHLMQREPTLAVWLADQPKEMLELFNEVATRVTLKLFPAYTSIVDEEICVRISEVPISDSLRDLRQAHLGVLVKVGGVVTRRTGVYPQIKHAYYDCLRCKDILGPFRMEEHTDFAPGSCPNPNCNSNGPFKLNQAKSVYRNYQRVVLQETPGTVPPGRVPRTKEVIMTNDLIDKARPGEEVEVTGVYECSNNLNNSMCHKSGFPVFHTHIEANHVLKQEDLMLASTLTDADKKDILKLAEDPKIGERLIQSIAPSIYGNEHVKRGIALALFGGSSKNISDKHRVRADINVLVLGDPGTAKSQVLKYCEKTAPRSVYSTGKGASAVGLTAAVHKDALTKEWTLEGGALVLADRGLCLIDEFDKMNEGDRTSIHEAMEQQTISISKAGIVASLQARCSVIAAANPIGGRYDSSSTFAENVELTDPILSRFDILCVLQDTVDPVADERLASFVTSSHMKATPTSEMRDTGRGAGIASILQNQERDERTQLLGQQSDSCTSPEPLPQQNQPPIPQHLLRKYIQYARSYVRPKLSDFDQEKVASLYVALRRESVASGGVPIAVRHIESLMRMAEAHAKMYLRDFVRDDDMDVAIEVMLNSFIQAQKFSVQRALKKAFQKYLPGNNGKTHLLLHILNEMYKMESLYMTMKRKKQRIVGMDETILIYVDEFEARAKERKIYDISSFLKCSAFASAGYLYNSEQRVILRSY